MGGGGAATLCVVSVEAGGGPNLYEVMSLFSGSFLPSQLVTTSADELRAVMSGAGKTSDVVGSVRSGDGDEDAAVQSLRRLEGLESVRHSTDGVWRHAC